MTAPPLPFPAARVVPGGSPVLTTIIGNEEA